MLLRSIDRKPAGDHPAVFPFSVPIIQSLQSLEFTAPVTFLVGENGSGKSTLLEALACAAALPTVGAESVQDDPTLAAIRPLADDLRLVWNKRARRGFFMRAEDFFGFARRMDAIRADFKQELARVDEEYKGRSKVAKGLASMPFNREIAAMRRAYGDGLDANSHGEGFLKLFQERFVGEGLYLLDEPEAPLSPSRQLSLLYLMHSAVQQGGQIIAATHSPILLAYPDAVILTCDTGRMQAVDYDSLEHVQLMRSFLANPEPYLRQLLS
jgi:predicted ATPase